MERNSLAHSAVWGLFIGIGIAIAGFTISNAIYKIKASERYVSVRGLAEREVAADLAIWPITFKEASDDLTDLQRRVDEKRALVTAFLEGAGFKKEDISYSAPKITDTQAEQNSDPRSAPKFRYVAQAAVTMCSNNVALVKKTIEQSATLVGKGVVLVESWENRTQFLFTGLNKIKPEMIETATVNAREAAAKFAKDSGSEVGKIRSATQGLFTIEDRDQNSPDRKKVRVVTTVEYFLVDR